MTSPLVRIQIKKINKFKYLKKGRRNYIIFEEHFIREDYILTENVTDESREEEFLKKK